MSRSRDHDLLTRHVRSACLRLNHFGSFLTLSLNPFKSRIPRTPLLSFFLAFTAGTFDFVGSAPLRPLLGLPIIIFFQRSQTFLCFLNLLSRELRIEVSVDDRGR